mmetsp:Transcript_63794/g.146102  ORF Transcript_63794/g.146102 Transcript_63794/m.146102 type:complete len:439 (-) Transcript_63794:74-1390(-)
MMRTRATMLGRRWEQLAVVGLVLTSPAGALTRGNPDPKPVPRVRQTPMPEAPSFLAPAAAEEVQSHVRAWFDVIESELSELTTVDYSKRAACVPVTGAYITLVVHISKSSYRLHCGEFSGSRGPPLKEILDVIVPGLPADVDVYVPFGLHDGVQNVRSGNLGIPVFGTMYHPMYSSIAVPFAMGTVRSPLPYVNTPVVGWDHFAKEWLKCNSTGARIKKAVFRGRTQWRGMKFGTCTQSCGWEDNGRWLLHMLGESHPDMFDTEATKINHRRKRSNVSDFLPLTEQLCNYQAILNVGSNSDWAERLRQCFYGNAVVMLPENPPSEFFTSFMRPWRHFWPIKPDLSDVVEQVSHVMLLENTSRQLQGQKDFGRKYLSEEFMYYYNKLAIMEYDARVKSSVDRTQAVQSSFAAEEARSLLKLGGCRRFYKRACPASQART